MAIIDKYAKGIALIVDEALHLLGTVTDGDVRRAILADVDLNMPVQVLVGGRTPTPRAMPRTASVGSSSADLLRMMNEYVVRHIPIVDDAGRVVGLVCLNDLVKEYELPLRAVIMAGGFGTRLRPLTDEIPKPMLAVGERPLLEVIIGQLRAAGIKRVNLTTHYKGEIIAAHFGDGRDFGVEIQYVKEDQPLGTAGALSLLEVSDEPLLVVNGDILTRVDFKAMLDFHREQQSDMTVGVSRYEFRVPYGVIETNGVRVSGVAEKPVIRHFINAGIYLLSPQAFRAIPSGRAYDMPDLIAKLVSEGRRVVSFPIFEYWLDIGQHHDYVRAQEDVENGRMAP
jgi:dTDP-glucose pyrophosphorylase